MSSSASVGEAEGGGGGGKKLKQPSSAFHIFQKDVQSKVKAELQVRQSRRVTAVCNGQAGMM